MVPFQHSKGIHLCWVPARVSHHPGGGHRGTLTSHGHGLDFTACNLLILGSLPSSLSLVDQPPLAFFSSIVFLTNKNVNWRAFSLFKHSKKVYLAGTTALVCKLIFFPLPSFLLCCTYSGSVEEGQGILYFRISSADFEKLSLNIL